MSRRWSLCMAILGALAFLSGCGSDHQKKISEHQMRTTASKNAKKLKLAMRQSTVKRNEASAPYKAKPESTSRIKRRLDARDRRNRLLGESHRFNSTNDQLEGIPGGGADTTAD